MHFAHTDMFDEIFMRQHVRNLFLIVAIARHWVLTWQVEKHGVAIPSPQNGDKMCLKIALW